MKHKKSEYLWKCYCRIIEARNNSELYPEEQAKLAKTSFDVLEKYLNALFKEIK